ncbi:hypothetical protein AMATHDRAFT_180288 [Amanita thiersii Skay4041]|uniref:Protein kinase domain-containing protein n=1 Tax=Amanita thiersii Skay4041 TaxID=703135 RepID=A0A2A9NLL3_9AGAR|nr:hypothetical protein AMATHDRAFT_180288 [Amanita thiersii Skay4041]
MSAALTREIHHHRQLHHPHVTQMYEVIATESSIWIVTELCCGGELFDYLVEKGRLSEIEARIIFGQLCLAVAYLHDKGIVHRDLKLENVLLDERCRVKLGDFGFTREYERGSFMETFCGTTGYAAPEMLLRKKYMGPEVDVWSLGVILFCLLTGTLPFDDDDEDIMRQKIIKGEFEDQEWLTLESRDLIKRILEKDVSKRYTIPQILGHPWFTLQSLHYEIGSPAFTPTNAQDSPDKMPWPSSGDVSLQSSATSTSSRTSESPFMSGSGTLSASAPTTPDDVIADPFLVAPIGNSSLSTIRRNSSESTLRKSPSGYSDPESMYSKISKTAGWQPETVVEEDTERLKSDDTSPPRSRRNSSGSKAPPTFPLRTPARTKRRSVSSTLSDPSSPTGEKSPTPLPAPRLQNINFSSLLNTPTPIIFSTSVEREVLSTLSALGFDTAQIVHSVLTDACDAAGAVWWMLKKRVEKRLYEEGDQTSFISSLIDSHIRETKSPDDALPVMSFEKANLPENKRVNVGVQADSPTVPNLVQLAPQLALVPATPTLMRPSTPPRPITPTRTPLLSPSSSSVTAESSTRSHPTTPATSVKDRDSKSRKPRSGSVSIMQRATTALEAAGLVRKKSSEGVKEDRDRERSKEMDRKATSAEEPRMSHGSSSSKLTKSPPFRAHKGTITPPPTDQSLLPPTNSPWVLTDSKDTSTHPTRNAGASSPANTPSDMVQSFSTPNMSDMNQGSKGRGNLRGRANILNAFRLWFHEDRKGKRKETSVQGSSIYNRTATTAQGFSSGKRRSSNSSSGKIGGRIGHRPQRPSISSRRSSSVNSRRSSVNSAHMVLLDSPQQIPARLFGAHTPNSERGTSGGPGGEMPSRPSSIRSFSMQQQRHRKSPSASSAGSAHFRTSSPMQKYHRRGGSGSSTRVVRQAPRPVHIRTNSTSSMPSPPSSRPTSLYEPSENEGQKLVTTSSPIKARSRRPGEDTSNNRRASTSTLTGTTFIAQKRQAPFASPISHGYSNSLGRSSWKKSWGLEPPGWQTRATQIPVEVLAISPASDSTLIRDVFSSRPSLSLGDESDWVDEDEEIPAFAGGLGQLGTTLLSSVAATHHPESTFMLSSAPPSRGQRTNNKRANRNSAPPAIGSGVNSRQKQGLSGPERPILLPDSTTETRTSRRQLPVTRVGPAFKHAIQEEDEDEE